MAINEPSVEHGAVKMGGIGALTSGGGGGVRQCSHTLHCLCEQVFELRSCAVGTQSAAHVPSTGDNMCVWSIYADGEHDSRGPFTIHFRTLR